MVNYPFNGNIRVSKVNFLRYYLGFSLGFQKSLDNDLMRDFEFVASEKNESSCQKKSFERQKHLLAAVVVEVSRSRRKNERLENVVESRKKYGIAG